MAISAARWMAVGITSLDDWPMFTWSLGWTRRSPRPPPRIWVARLAMTSLALVLVEVPEPVWKMSSTKCSSNFPSATSCAASTMALAIFSSSRPRARFVLAAASFTRPKACMNPRGNRRSLIGKFSTARMVDAPYNAAAGTSIGPIESRSILTLVPPSLSPPSLSPVVELVEVIR